MRRNRFLLPSVFVSVVLVLLSFFYLLSVGNASTGAGDGFVKVPASTYAAIQMSAAGRHYSLAIIYAEMKNYSMARIERDKGNQCAGVARWAVSSGRDTFMVDANAAEAMDTLGDISIDEGVIDPAKLDALIKELEAANIENPEEFIKALEKAQGDLAFADGLLKNADGSIAIDDLVALTDANNSTISDSNSFLIRDMNSSNMYSPSDMMCLVEGAEAYGATYEYTYADGSSSLDPVILYSGEFKVEATDLLVKSVGLDFEFKRVYRNQWERASSMGYNWTYNYNQQLYVKDNGAMVLFKNEDGQLYPFKQQEGGKYAAPYQLFAKLEKTEKGYTITDGEGLKKYFDLNGNLVSINDRFSNTMKFEYVVMNEKKVLKHIYDTLGRLYTLSYEEGWVSSLRDPFGRVVKYTHNSNGDLETVRTPTTQKYEQGRVTRYNYTGGFVDASLNHNLAMIMDPKGQVYLKNDYGSEGVDKDRVIAQRFGSESAPVMKVAYEIVKGKNGINDVASITKVTNRLGVQNIYEHNRFGLRLKGDGYRYHYNKDALMTMRTSPEGIATEYVYDTVNTDRLKQNNLLRVVEKGKAKERLETLYTYAAYNQLASEVRVGGDSLRKVELDINAKGLVVSKKSGDDVSTFAYNEKGQVIKEARDKLTREY
ncbi:MAG: DUF6531 domain-containing protein, partial [Pseudomonadota bacterium]